MFWQYHLRTVECERHQIVTPQLSAPSAHLSALSAPTALQYGLQVGGTHTHRNKISFCSPGPRGLNFTWSRCCSLCFQHKLTELAHSFLLCSCVYVCLYDPFNCISFRKFSRQLSAFSLCCSSLISALLVLSAIYPFMKVSFSPEIILCG